MIVLFLTIYQKCLHRVSEADRWPQAWIFRILGVCCHLETTARNCSSLHMWLMQIIWIKVIRLSMCQTGASKSISWTWGNVTYFHSQLVHPLTVYQMIFHKMYCNISSHHSQITCSSQCRSCWIEGLNILNYCIVAGDLRASESCHLCSRTNADGWSREAMRTIQR